MSLPEKIYHLLPSIAQNILITLYSYLHRKKRYSKKYDHCLKVLKRHEFSSREQLDKLQEEKFLYFLKYAYNNSEFYNKKYAAIDISKIKIKGISKLPILTKEELRSNLKEIVTIERSDSYVSHTGGTTGKSLTVLFDWDDFQERMAMLDLFRQRFCPSLSQKTAWFSGKNLIGSKRGNYWRTDYLSKIRYYSTFHINSTTAKSYIKNINTYQPQIFVGFPSSMVEIAKFGISNSLCLDYVPQAIFPTAETLIDGEIEILKKFFKCGVYNQYASSEGAPFITECENGELHYEMLSGIIEVVDNNGCPADSGEILITSFTTKGTPLIRYKIGDSITLKPGTCDCGRKTPLVKNINGRINDYIYSEERGRINLGNISNCVKYTEGIIKFQIIQNEISSIRVKLLVDHNTFKEKDNAVFLNELRARLGTKININIQLVNSISREKSGKFRIVKSSIKLP